jgi:uncharacterized protein YjbI with pentapeptide repeats
VSADARAAVRKNIATLEDAVVPDVDESAQPSSIGAAGSGWDVISWTAALDLFRRTAPVIYVAGFLLISALFALGILLIWRLIEISWTGSADESVRAASAALTAIAAIFGAIFLSWRTVIAHWSARASQHQASVAREAHLTTLFTKAVEFLGATREMKITKDIGDSSQAQSSSITEPNIEVRLGAIYALERIAKDSERDHLPVMEVLCAYIRNPQNSGIPKRYESSMKSGDLESSIGEVRIDVQAALTVIGRRSSNRIEYERKNGFRLNFEAANLQNANLSRGNFSYARFKRASLDLARVDLAEMQEANFWGASLVSATFQYSRLQDACFASANLTNASLINSSLERCLFHRATLLRTAFFRSRLGEARFFNTRLYFTSISQEQLDDTLGDINSTPPEGLVRPDAWFNRELTLDEISRYMVTTS